MRKISAMMIMVVMILPVLCVLSVNDAKAENVKADVESGGFVDITLYLHNDSTLDTIEPTSENVTIEELDSKTFETEYLLTNLNVDGVNITIEFWVDLYFVLGTLYPPQKGSANVTITFSIYDHNTKINDNSWVKNSGEIRGEWSYTTPKDSPDTVQIDLSSWDDEKQFDDTVKLVITPTIDTTNEQEDLRRADFYYDSTDYPSSLQIRCAPVEITLSTYDKDNKQVDEFMPNLAAEDCIIRFRGGIEDAFGYEDITYVGIEINGVTSSENITANKEKELLYEWDYSKYSFVAGTPYTATVTVDTVQHTFTQTTSFNFSAYGLEAKIDDDPSKASETILAGSQADYTISMRNTGASKADVRVTLTIFVVTPGGLHEWNISLDGKSKEVNTTTATSVNPANLSYPDFELSGGSPKSLTLTAESLGPEDVGENWYCKVDIKIEFVGHSEIEPETLSATTYLAPPYKIDVDWTKTYNDPYYVLVDVQSYLYVNVTNMGTMPDTVNFTLNYTNPDVWGITLEPKTVNLSSFHHSGYYNSNVKLTVKPSSGAGEDTTFVNITACSKGFAQGYNETLTRKYLTLNLSRAFGITMDVELKGTGEVDVKDSDGKAIYEVSIKTNDNTTHTVDLNAVCNNENIDVRFDDDSVAVSKDSPKNVTMTVTCPKGMLAGSYTITVNASIRGAPVLEHNKTANVIVTVNEYYALSVVWADSNKNNITVTAAPGEYFYRTLRVTNKGNSNISVSIDLVNDYNFQLFDSAVPSQFSLSYGEEKNVTIYLYIPKDAKDGDTFVVHMETSGAGSPKSSVITIEIKQDIWGKLIATLYSMIYFIILLIAVVVVFISVWVKKKKMR